MSLRVTIPPDARRAQARAAALERHHPEDGAAIAHERQEAKFLTLAEYVRRTVDTWPPLDPEQRDRLAAILRGSPDA